MRKIFANSEELSKFMQQEHELALTRLSQKLSVERSSVAFIFEETDLNPDDLEIPRRF